MFCFFLNFSAEQPLTLYPNELDVVDAVLDVVADNSSISQGNMMLNADLAELSIADEDAPVYDNQGT